MFLFKPELADEDDEEATDDPNLYRREEEVDEVASSVATLTLESLAAAAKAADGTGTCSKTLSAKDRETAHAPTSSSVPDCNKDMANGTCPADENGLDLACAVSSPEEAPATTTSDALDLDGIPVDESLFEEDVDIEDDDLDLND